MQSKEHMSHWPNGRTIHANCPECNADRERRFVDSSLWRYQHVADYLAYVRPRLEAIHQGDSSPEARRWLRDFRKAMDQRISMKAGLPKWRKMCDSYLERLAGMRYIQDPVYLREFATRKASAID